MEPQEFDGGDVEAGHARESRSALQRCVTIFGAEFRPDALRNSST